MTRKTLVRPYSLSFFASTINNIKNNINNNINGAHLFSDSQTFFGGSQNRAGGGKTPPTGRFAVLTQIVGHFWCQKEC